MKYNIISLLLLASLAAVTLASRPLVFPKAKELAKRYGMDKMTPAHYARRNQGTAWRKINILFDLTKLNQQNPSMKKFYAKIFEITYEWYQDALWVRDDRSKIPAFVKKHIKTGEIDGFSTNDFAGYDLLVNVKMIKDDGGTLAQAGPMLRHPDSQRPITGITEITWFGDKNFKSANDGIHMAVGTIVHEFAHVIAFIEWETYQKRYFKYQPSGKLYYFNGPKVVQAMAHYYGCSTDEASMGMPVETFGRREPGAHWDESFVDDELMSPVGGEEPEKLSPMSMALFEDSGWYKSNYGMIENYTFRKGAGCGAAKPSKGCPKPSVCRADDSDFVTKDFKGIGYCDEDSKGCPVEVKYANRNSNLAKGWERSYTTFGATYGNNSTIAEGVFNKFEGRSVAEETQVSVLTRCNNGGKSYTLTFKGFKLKRGRHSGDVDVTCSSKGKQTFNNDDQFPSHVKCNDPKTFCESAFGANGASGDGSSGGCDASCVKNGRCHPNNVSQARNLSEMFMLALGTDEYRRELGTMPMPRPDRRPTPKKAPSTKRGLGTMPMPRPDRRPTPKKAPVSVNRKLSWMTNAFGADTEPARQNQAVKGDWKCWCYSDGQERDVCPSIANELK